MAPNCAVMILPRLIGFRKHKVFFEVVDSSVARSRQASNSLLFHILGNIRGGIDELTVADLVRVPDFASHNCDAIWILAARRCSVFDPGMKVPWFGLWHPQLSIIWGCDFWTM